MTTVVLTSAALFCAHCMLQQDKAAALHPPLMYACVVALLLLPWDAAFKVRFALSFSFTGVLFGFVFHLMRKQSFVDIHTLISSDVFNSDLVYA